MMMMTMYFHQRLEEIILFKEWNTVNTAGFALSCLVICLSALFYELLRGVHSFLDQRFSSRKACCDADIYYYSDHRSQPLPVTVSSSTISVPGATCECEQVPKNEAQQEKELLKPDKLTRQQVKLHLIGQSLLYMVRLWWSFCLMLVAMTYNWCLFGSLVIGHALGYALAGPMFQSVEWELRIGDCACG
uniref:Copper transport protein n=1 Tax=Ditylenchus dipsaci TaxID=166011 RepID=A0A915DLY6_9BILA